MKPESTPSLAVWTSSLITGTLIAWLVTGACILLWLATLNRGDAITTAELAGAEEPPRQGVMLEQEDFAYALVPLYFFKWTERNDEGVGPEWIRERKKSNNNFVRNLQLLRFALVAVGGFVFANKVCGKHPLIQAVVQSPTRHSDVAS